MTGAFPDSRPLFPEGTDLTALGHMLANTLAPPSGGGPPWTRMVMSGQLTWKVDHFPCRGRGHRWHRVRWLLRHPVRYWRGPDLP